MSLGVIIILVVLIGLPSAFVLCALALSVRSNPFEARREYPEVFASKADEMEKKREIFRRVKEKVKQTKQRTKPFRASG